MKRCVRKHLLAATCAVACSMAGIGTARSESIAAPAGWLPQDAQLEAMGARIGVVYVRVAPIFDGSDDREDRPLFRLADRLHIDTRAPTIRAHLLFQSGDFYSRRILDETARHLRKQRYVREPRVRPVAFHDGLVDVEVVVQDVWTTSPGISFGRAGGENHSGIELEELNLLGFGKQVSFDYSRNVDRSSYTFRWVDPSVWGSRWRDTVALTRSDDGRGYELGLERPFYSLDSRWSAGFLAARDQGIDRFYALGHPVSAFQRDERLFDLHVGWSRGLVAGWVHRWTTGLRTETKAFSPLEGAAPSDRELAYPYVRFEAVQDHFETARNLNQIARTEDLRFGVRYALELGVAAPAFGADRSAGIVRAQMERGFRFAEGGMLFFAGELTGRMEQGSAMDTLLAADLRYYLPTSERSKFVAALSAAYGHELDADHELLLDGDSGLRGYPLRYQAGHSRLLLTLEERVYTNWSLWHLAQVGGAVFADVGRTWGTSSGGGESLGLLTDVGFGLRLGSTRSALANVLHLDIAFPIGADPSIRNVQFLIKTRQSF